ncbi:hypothetical protein ACFOGG_10285 [Brenneria rubrifaciens]
MAIPCVALYDPLANFVCEARLAHIKNTYAGHPLSTLAVKMIAE